MSSLGPIQDEEDTTRQHPTPIFPSPLINLPTETLIEILTHTNFESLNALLQTNHRLRSIIHLHWPQILPLILEREFSPTKPFFDTLWNVDLPEGMDCAQLLSVSGMLLLPSSSSSDGSGHGLQPVLTLCRAVKRWEAEFPRLRFASVPEHARCLGPHELARLRGALYVWWRFARAFHGLEEEASGPHLDGGVEARRVFVRALSTAELHELYDMWQTVRAAVGRRVCPSVSVVRGRGGRLLTREEGARVGWGDFHENSDIVGTMMKLRPEDILHLLVYRHWYATKGSVVQFVRLRHPRIEESVECFSEAILDVLCERGVSAYSPFPCTGYPNIHGGILDHKNPEAEQTRFVHTFDAGARGLATDNSWRLAAYPPRVRRGRLEASS